VPHGQDGDDSSRILDKVNHPVRRNRNFADVIPPKLGEDLAETREPAKQLYFFQNGTAGALGGSGIVLSDLFDCFAQIPNGVILPY